MNQLLLVALGAVVGAPLRYAAGVLWDRSLPLGTIAVNIAGSFVLGALSGAALSENAMAALGAGFCGALTTYSAFAVQTHDAGPRRGAFVVLLTLPPALAACALGYLLTSSL